MKALSIQEPWLSKIVSGEKTIETRTWYTNHRYELLLVGSKKPKGVYSGVAACVVDLSFCRRMREEDAEEAQCPYRYDLWAWMFKVLRYVEPFEVRGQLGIYEVKNSLIKYRRTPWKPNDLTLNL